jgi:predicted metal-dependent HD superfamily phosphohydrolase
MQFKKAYLFLLAKLKKELPNWLTYHNLQHTKDVVEAVQYLAKCEKVNKKDFTLLSTAAAFHDAGFIEGYNNHEEMSCNVARTNLPQFGFSEEDIGKICELIMVTKIPQTPKNHLEQIMCDGDLLYLGTDSFERISENLFKEFLKKGIVKDRDDWNDKQNRFLNAHKFFTKFARQNYTSKKEENIKQLCNSLEKK